MSLYRFDEQLFKNNFNAKEPGVKPADSCRLNHAPDNCFKLYPYKATAKSASPIVYDLSDCVSGFFRKSLGISIERFDYNDLFQKVKDIVEIESDEVDFFGDIIRDLFFKGNNFKANNIGLYPYQTVVDNKSAEKISDFLYSILDIDENDKKTILDAGNEYPFNVLEKMVVESLKSYEGLADSNEKKYFIVKRSIQKKFKEDFRFMLSSGMTSIDDISNVLSFYYFYYVSQCVITLDQFGNGDRNKLENLYYALDWEKVSKNRKCCTDGWDKLSENISRMFYHAITLEILNQNDLDMMDYIDFKILSDENDDSDTEIASEIKRAEENYISYIGDCKKFDSIGFVPGANKTDSAMRHLFECVLLQFNETDRKRACQAYSEKFSEFCKSRFVKNRKKSGLVLNLTERDIIFLTKLSLRDRERIRLNELYLQYEERGVYLDATSKMLLQDFFTRLNLIDKKSDSGDAQYVKRIL